MAKYLYLQSISTLTNDGWVDGHTFHLRLSRVDSGEIEVNYCDRGGPNVFTPWPPVFTSQEALVAFKKAYPILKISKE